MASFTIERVSSLPVSLLSEGPYWDPATESLLYVDVFVTKLFRYYPKTDQHRVLSVEPSASGKTISFVLPVAGHPDLLLLSVGRHIGLVTWRDTDPDVHSTTLCPLVELDTENPGNIVNDAKCDFRGGLWAGTMGEQTTPGVVAKEKAKLYFFSPDMTRKVVVDKVNLSNGLAWSADNATFYYNDTTIQSVDAFDFDAATNTIGNRRKVVDYKAVGLPDDLPDGMTIDTDGNLWVANYNGNKILCIDPKQSRIIRTIELPISNPTSLAWGGPDYSTLYITSGRMGLTDEQLQAKPDNGGIFKIVGLGAKGSPAVKVKLSQEIIDKIA